jgi:5'-deoxynucleotidase YfbR-like HD superfamily hydrolase
MEYREPEFLFALSEPTENISELGQAVLHLSEVAERLANEDRTLVDHDSGRPENVAEHSNMLAIIGPAVAEQFFPELDQNLIARYASIHDLIEAYVGDTPTHSISEQGLLDKEAIEKIGLQKLKEDFVHLPKFVEFVESYEQQKVPEARFVRVLDKCMPALMHFANGGVVLRRYINKEDLLENSALRSATLRRNYPEFERLIALREELSALIANIFLT